MKLHKKLKGLHQREVLIYSYTQEHIQNNRNTAITLVINLRV